MKKILHFQFNYIALASLIVGLAIGFLIMAQWKVKPIRVQNPVLPFVTLRTIRDNLTKEQNDLKIKIAANQKESNDLTAQIKKDKKESSALLDDYENSKKEVGLTDLAGDGVLIMIDDSRGPATIDSITHAADLRDLVDFLWANGAAAISINGERLIYNSSIDCIVNTVLINNTKTTPPFNILVIGNANKLSNALNDENNLREIRKRVKNQGLVFRVSAENNLKIPVYNGSFKIETAKIAE